ncbi:MAG: GNAT family N-acetyltransferase [Chloroflexota bacterium]
MTQYDQPPYTIPPLRTAYIRPLIHTDLNAVMAIDRQSYPSPRPRLAYERELKNNQMAKNFVIEWQNKDSLTILGIGGFWLLADEIHITTVAVNPDWRRLGLGEWLLVALIHAGQAAGGTVATLEVRPSNKSAQAL